MIVKLTSPDNQDQRIFRSVDVHNFHYCELKGKRRTQEDVITWCSADRSFHNISAKDIGYRLWTTYQLLNQSEICRLNPQVGTTASTTIYDGKGSLITATLGDSVVFAALYDIQDKLIHVERLNRTLHTPYHLVEAIRIEKAGGLIVDHPRYGKRVQFGGVSGLGLTRAIGDYSYANAVSADAQIDITTLGSLEAKAAQKTPYPLKEIKLIVTCDGYTEPLNDAHKIEQEKYLTKHLLKYKPMITLADHLAASALHDGSMDNISVAVQSIPIFCQQSYVVGVYDGHGGNQLSRFVSETIVNKLFEQCRLPTETYNSCEYSVVNLQHVYFRDHPSSALTRPLPASLMSAMNPSRFYHPLQKYNFDVVNKGSQLKL